MMLVTAVLRQSVWVFDSSQTQSGGVPAEKSKKIFQVVLISHLEGVVVQASLEQFAVLTSWFTIIVLNLTPGEKPDKTQNII